MSKFRKTDKDRDKVIGWTAQGVSRVDMAKRLSRKGRNCSVSTLQRHFKEEIKRPQGIVPRKFSDGEIELAKDAAAGGRPRRYIAERLGCSVTTLQKHLGDQLSEATFDDVVEVEKRLRADAKLPGNIQAQRFYLINRTEHWQSEKLGPGGTLAPADAAHIQQLGLVDVVRQLTPGSRKALGPILREIKAIQAAQARKEEIIDV